MRQQHAQTTIGVLLNELKACSLRKDLQRGRRAHARAVDIQIDSDKHVATALIRMYAKCGNVEEAQGLFDNMVNPDVVSWNVLLLGYAESGEGLAALDLFLKMKAQGYLPSSITYIAALKACTSLALKGDVSKKRHCLERGRRIHIEIGSLLDHYLQNTLVDMYAKCGSMLDAQVMFNSIKEPDIISWNALILGYAEYGDVNTAFNLFSKMKACGCKPDSTTYVAIIKACTGVANNFENKYLDMGKSLHLEIGCRMNQYVQSTLIDMYAKYGEMVYARQVFDSIETPDVVSWNTLLLGYAENGEGCVALDMFSKMQERGCSPDSVTYIAAFKACAFLAASGDISEKKVCLLRGRHIHTAMGQNFDHHLQNTLMDMYAKCGSMVDAHIVFDNIQNPDVVSWNTLLLGYVLNGDGYASLDVFFKMKMRGCVPDSVTYLVALKACTSLAANKDDSDKRDILNRGKELHSEIGCQLNHFLQNALMDMYAKCSSLSDAQNVFDGIQNPDVVSWTVLLLAYADNEEGHVVLELFSKMKTSGCLPDNVTYIAALKACGSIGALACGRKFHSELGEINTTHLVTSLVDFYAKCGSMTEAHQVFDMHSKATGTPIWNALLGGYSSFGDYNSVFKLFDSMKDKGFNPDATTFACLLLCCSHAGFLEKARECFEGMTAGYGISPTARHHTCMVDVLGRANRLGEAILMLHKLPCAPDVATWTQFLAACRRWKNVDIGRMAFQSLVGLHKNTAFAYVLMGQLYGDAGFLEERSRLVTIYVKKVTFTNAKI